MKKLYLGFCLLWLAMPGMAAEYKTDIANSHIRFNGTHAGKTFTGEFKNFTTDIVFDPADLAHSHIRAKIDTASATTGDKTYDGTLPTADWFDTKKFPEAEFISTAIAKNPDGSFRVDGTLTIRGIAKPCSFAFTLTPGTNGQEIGRASLVINRLDYGIGQKSDAAAAWVGRDITLDLLVAAIKL